MTGDQTHSNLIDLVVPNNGFFPDLNVKDFQEVMRVPAHLIQNTVVDALVNGILQINSDLESWSQQKKAEGFATLQDVAQRILGGGTPDEYRELNEHYRAAVFNQAMAILHPMLVSILGKQEAIQYAEKTGKHEADYYNKAAELLGRIQGQIKGRKHAMYGSICI